MKNIILTAFAVAVSLSSVLSCSKSAAQDYAAVECQFVTRTPGGSSTSFTYGGTSTTGYSQSSGSSSASSETYTSSGSDENAVQVTGGSFTMTDCTVTKTGDTSTSGDETSFYGVNSAIFAGNESTSTTAAITISGGSITTNAKGSNAIFAYGGGTITVSDLSIDNTARASRGLIATGGGTIIGTNLDIVTRDETSSVIATDRGGGTVSVDGGSYVTYGNKCAIIYSAGTMVAQNAEGSSANGEIGVIEGDNSITITNCNFTSGSSSRGLLMMQSGSGDASGTNPVMTITDSELTMTDSSAPLIEVATLVTATCTLDNVSLTVPSGILMAVMEDSQWSTSGASGTLILNNGEYTGQVYADSGYTANVTVGSDAVWSLTANTTLNTLINNGIIVTNGYTLTAGTSSGSGEVYHSVASYGPLTVYVNEDGTSTTAVIDGDSSEDCSLSSSLTADQIIYSRTFSAGVPATICLPFQVSGISGAALYEFSGVSYDTSSSKWVAAMTAVDSAAADTPYIIVPSASGSVTLTGSGTFNPSASLASTSGTWTFNGTYVTRLWSSSENASEIGYAYGFASSSSSSVDAGQFVKVASGAGIYPFRAYLIYTPTKSCLDSLPNKICVILKDKNGNIISK